VRKSRVIDFHGARAKQRRHQFVNDKGVTGGDDFVARR
jgi:hypothetical protein